MSYYAEPTQTPLLSTAQNMNPAGNVGANASPSQIYSPTGTGFVQRDVDPNSLVSNQLHDLLSGDSQYIQQARDQAGQQAASRGLLNSSIASGAGQAAAIAAGLPIAGADASTYATTDANNMDAENAFLLNQGQWNTQRQISRESLASAQANARMQEASDANRLAEQGREYDLNRTDSNAHYDTDWQHQVTQNDWNRQNFIGSGLVNTIIGDPTLWRDPQGATGFFNYYANNLNNIWDSAFPGDGSTSSSPTMPSNPTGGTTGQPQTVPSP